MDGSPGQPLDLRKLGYFVAVAEELHFGRAAERLYIAQSVLSRQIRRLEEEMGVALLERTTRNVELTPAGRQLLEDARVLLATADAARRRMHEASDGPTVLTVGFFVGDQVAPAMRAFAAKQPTVTVELLRVYWHDQVAVLHDGRADVAFVHLPIDATGLRVLPVRREPRVAVLPLGHPAAGAASVTIAELGEDPVIRQRGANPVWEAFHNVDPRPDGRHPTAGPVVDNIEEKLEHVASGRAISFLPRSAAAAYAYGRPDVVCVEVTDIPPTEVCLAWPEGRTSPAVLDFAESVRRSVRPLVGTEPAA